MWQDALVTACVVYHQCFQKSKESPTYIRGGGWALKNWWAFGRQRGSMRRATGQKPWKVWTGCFRWVTRRIPLPEMGGGKVSSTQCLVASEFAMCVLTKLGCSQATRSRNVPSFLRWWGLSKEWNLGTQRCTGRTRL